MRNSLTCSLLGFCLVFGPEVLAQFRIDSSSLEPGGPISGGGYSLRGGIRPTTDSARIAGDGFVMDTSFWSIDAGGAAVPPPPELHIAVTAHTATDLHLSVTLVAGQTYVVETRADAAAGDWAPVPNGTLTGTGDALDVTIPNAFTQSQGFYRVRRVSL